MKHTKKSKASKAKNLREVTQILAALRYWQDEELGGQPLNYVDYFEEITPLSSEEIDDLCERINFGEWPDKKARETILTKYKKGETKNTKREEQKNGK